MTPALTELTGRAQELLCAMRALLRAGAEVEGSPRHQQLAWLVSQYVQVLCSDALSLAATCWLLTPALASLMRFRAALLTLQSLFMTGVHGACIFCAVLNMHQTSARNGAQCCSLAAAACATNKSFDIHCLPMRR